MNVLLLANQSIKYTIGNSGKDYMSRLEKKIK